uniref:Uncharacterized protein n=1 Tax=Arundo donax TaxID=35708 RepID=A0A0A9AKY4_ARUDO
MTTTYGHCSSFVSYVFIPLACTVGRRCLFGMDT